MRSVAAKVLCVSAVLVSAAIGGYAQQAAPDPKDPRVGLKPGLRDAGVAARNMELVSTMPKPEGFFDPKNPAGEATPPERPANASPEPASAPAPSGASAGQAPAASAAPAPAAPGSGTPAAPPGGGGGGLNFANSDLAFSGTHMFQGNFHGFNTYDIESGKNPRLIASIVCPGGQGDVSVHGNLLFMSVEQNRGRIDCGVQGVATPVSNERFRGVRIFDITDLRKPRQVAAVQTCRGSHTHTLVTDPKNTQSIFVYGSGTGPVRAGEELTGCVGGDPKENPETALFSIDVIEVPLAAPETARIVNRPRIFADTATGSVAGLWAGRRPRSRHAADEHDQPVPRHHGVPGRWPGRGRVLGQRHPARHQGSEEPEAARPRERQEFRVLAFGHVQQRRHQDRVHRRVGRRHASPLPRDRPPQLGRRCHLRHRRREDEVRELLQDAGGADRSGELRGAQRIDHPGARPRHHGAGLYQGGLSVYDFTDSTKPVEIAYFDRGPIDAKNLVTGGYWSTYWYNGNIYGSEITRGMDIFRLKPSEYLSRNEIDAAILVHAEDFNAQEQPKITWPATTVVARAYLDQLNRSKSLAPARATAVKQALEKIDDIRTGKERNAAATLDQADGLATQLEADAASATGRTAERMKALAATIKGRTARLR